jgi:hypothetical protein
MFRAPPCPSSGTHDYIPLFTTWNVCFLGLDAGGYGTVAASPATQPANPPHLTTIKTQEADVPCGEQWYIIESS